MNRSPSLNQKPSVLKQFLFAEEVPYGAALSRMALPLAAAIPMVMRFPHVRELYTTDGANLQLFELYGRGAVFTVLSPALAVPLYGIMLFAMFCSIIGLRTRLSLATVFVLYVYFNLLDGVSTITKYSAIASHMLLLLTVSNCGAVWSVDAWLKKRRGGSLSVLPPKSAVWPVRLMQLLFAAIYFGAAITKIQTTEFFSGEQMRYWMLSNWNYENPIGEFMAMWSPILLVSAYLAVIWEILFAFLVWQPRTRLPMLLIGALFHFMTWLTLGLYIFPAICMASYFAFANEADVIWLRHFAKRIRLASVVSLPFSVSRRALQAIPQLMPASVAWVCLLAVTALGAAELEYRMDIYGRNAPAGTMALKPMDAVVANTMIHKEQRVRQKDKFFNFEIGTSTIGGQLSNRKTEFEFGELMIAQCNMNPPHEDMWVECVLEDEESRVVERFGQFVTREMLRANFTYYFGDRLLPGNYSIILKNRSKEIYRRDFALTGEPPVKTSNHDMLTN